MSVLLIPALCITLGEGAPEPPLPRKKILAPAVSRSGHQLRLRTPIELIGLIITRDGGRPWPDTVTS